MALKRMLMVPTRSSNANGDNIICFVLTLILLILQTFSLNRLYRRVTTKSRYSDTAKMRPTNSSTFAKIEHELDGLKKLPSS